MKHSKIFKPKNVRVITILRKKHPDFIWKYDRESQYPWVGIGRNSGSKKIEVGAFARSTPLYDGDDETVTVEYRYKDGERLPFFELRQIRF